MRHTYNIDKLKDCSIANIKHLSINIPYYKVDISVLTKKSKYIAKKDDTEIRGRKWIRRTGIKAIKAAAQTAVAAVGTSAILMSDVNWAVIVSASILSAIISVLNSVVEIPENL